MSTGAAHNIIPSENLLDTRKTLPEITFSHEAETLEYLIEEQRVTLLPVGSEYMPSSSRIYAAHGKGEVNAVNPVLYLAATSIHDLRFRNLTWQRIRADLMSRFGYPLPQGVHSASLTLGNLTYYVLLERGDDWIRKEHPLIGLSLKELQKDVYHEFERYSLDGRPFPVGPGYVLVRPQQRSSSTGDFLREYLCQPPAPRGSGW